MSTLVIPAKAGTHGRDAVAVFRPTASVVPGFRRDDELGTI
jgi:hypothetical protein